MMSGPYHNLSDPKTLEQCLADMASGDRTAFEDLYNLTHASIYAFALSVVGNAHDAQDIMHDTYLKIYSAAPFYQAKGTPMAWILTIAKHLSVSLLRERKKNAEISPEEWDQHIPPSEDTEREERISLTEALKHLTEEERQIVILHAVSDLKHREIAHLLDLPLATVLSKYRRALKKLENNL